MNTELRSTALELLDDLVRIAAEVMVEACIEADVASQCANEIADRMSAHWGGSSIYFPMGLSRQRSKRDREIYAEFNGRNQNELARKHRVSLPWIYKIIKAVGAEEQAKRQGDMFQRTED
ncbi:MAG: hypothetical protein LBE62_03110 [Azonexus sp.]|nr:hypothetical protein [Azonexus sp.]